MHDAHFYVQIQGKILEPGINKTWKQWTDWVYSGLHDLNNPRFKIHVLPFQCGHLPCPHTSKERNLEELMIKGLITVQELLYLIHSRILLAFSIFLFSTMDITLFSIIQILYASLNTPLIGIRILLISYKHFYFSDNWFYGSI